LRNAVVLAPAAAIMTALARSNSGQLLNYARHGLAARWPGANAFHGASRVGRGIFVAIAVVLLFLAFGAAYLPELLFLPLIGIAIVVPAALRLGALIAAKKDEPPARLLSDTELPVYSVLIPLRDEAHMVPLLYRAMSALAYPPEKLEIRFVVEARSERTVAAVRDLLGDPRFGLIEVPDAPPYTKPKALCYALSLIRGEYVVVYDAEDIPNSDQLRLAASTFAARPDLTCLQAELVVDNARENLLTALFTGEYAGQFGLMMPALARWGLAVPLGGTSNHFRLRDLRAIGGWDAFNVTEDADLGLRLARLRNRIAMLPSQTYEEQPITVGMWLRQRTRWMKGWMQTFIVHNQHPVLLAKDLGPKAFLAFEIYVGSIILSPLLHTAFLGNLMLEMLLGGRLRFLPPFTLSRLEMVILVLGYGTSFLLAVAGLLRFGQRRLLIQQLVLPIYWVLHSVATLRASYDLLTKPHFWDKTTHGLTKLERSFDGEGGR
jgi:cellulose synthase/poly-beta-1,6-N-acetylglucosamine synthase-like glycosyltransferase